MKYHVYFCKDCGKRRRHYNESTRTHWIYVCSKGHRYVSEVAVVEQIFKDIFLPGISEFLNSKNPLSSILRSK